MWNLSFSDLFHLVWQCLGICQDKVKLSRSCLTLCDLMDCSTPGSSVHGILQARILEWVAISFSKGSSQSGDQTQVSHIAGRFFILFHFFWCLSNITLYIYISLLLYLFLCECTFRLLSCLIYCKQCYNEHCGAWILWTMFFFKYMNRIGIAGS